MKNVGTELNSKRNAVSGTVKQAKGLAREKIVQVKHDPKMRLAGKKDQVVGTLQKNIGSSWGYKNRGFLAAFTTIAAVLAVMIYVVNKASHFVDNTNPYDPRVS
jgi:uncharacterized protein YjbJ (UPF0337 family)